MSEITRKEWIKFSENAIRQEGISYKELSQKSRELFNHYISFTDGIDALGGKWLRDKNTRKWIPEYQHV